VILDGSALTAREIAAAGRGGAVAIAPGALQRIAHTSAFADEVAARRPVYGRSTGVGANRGDRIEDPAAHARRLLRSHATSAGPLRSPSRVRAMLVVRLNQLLAGGSGVRPEIVQALEALLDGPLLPAVREHGGVGTGDLAALACTALLLSGEAANRPAHTVEFTAADALAFLSSNAATIADAALGADALTRLGTATLSVAAATFDATGANAEAFSPAAEIATPFPGAERTARILRGLIGVAPPRRVQDPFGLRALPQVHGAFLDQLERLEAVIAAMSAAPAENPVFLPEVGMAHHAAFHAAALAQALDATVSATAQTAQLSLARLAMLCDPAMTGLPRFLGDGTIGASGVMGCEYVAAAALGSLRALATPAAVQSVNLSIGMEEDVSFASLAARQALDAVAHCRTVLACELVAAVRALRMQGLRPPALGAALPADPTDRDLTEDLALAAQALAADVEYLEG
jgi:histidine ammonia-lyase